MVRSTPRTNLPTSTLANVHIPVSAARVPSDSLHPMYDRAHLHRASGDTGRAHLDTAAKRTQRWRARAHAFLVHRESPCHRSTVDSDLQSNASRRVRTLAQSLIDRRQALELVEGQGGRRRGQWGRYRIDSCIRVTSRAEALDWMSGVSEQDLRVSRRSVIQRERAEGAWGCRASGESLSVDFWLLSTERVSKSRLARSRRDRKSVV